MGLTAAMSFSGPTAPITAKAQRRNRMRRQIPADLFRLLLAVLVAGSITTAGFCGLVVTTAPAWLSLVVQPCSLLLLPGYLTESLDQNGYAFSSRGVLAISWAFYFYVALLLLFARRDRPKS